MSASHRTYDFLIKAIIVGDTGVGKSCLLLRETENTFFTHSFITLVGLDFKIRTYDDIDGAPSKRIKAQLWDTAGQEGFRNITNTHLRGATLIYLVYDVTDEQSFQNIRNYIRDFDRYDNDTVNSVLIGNKADMVSERVVETSRGQALADEYGIPFFEVSAKTDNGVHEAFKRGLSDTYKRLCPPSISVPPPPSQPAIEEPQSLSSVGSFLWSAATAPFRGVWWLLTWPIKK